MLKYQIESMHRHWMTLKPHEHFARWCELYLSDEQWKPMDLPQGDGMFSFRHMLFTENEALPQMIKDSISKDPLFQLIHSRYEYQWGVKFDDIPLNVVLGVLSKGNVGNVTMLLSALAYVLFHKFKDITPIRFNVLQVMPLSEERMITDEMLKWLWDAQKLDNGSNLLDLPSELLIPELSSTK